MSVILIHSDRFAEHQTPPGHPERPERAEAMDAVAARWRERGTEIVAPRAATHEQLARVHDDQYLRTIAATAGRAMQLDPDTYTSPESHDIALLAAGAAIDAVERVMGGLTPRGGRDGAPARPPCRTRSRDGVLSLQQRRGCGRARPRARRREGCDRRLRRAPREWHAAHLRDRSPRALHLDAPVPLLPGHRRGRRDRHATPDAGSR